MNIKNLIICVLFLSTLTTYGEDNLKKVDVKYRKTKIREVYYVKKPDNVIKQGEYKQFGFDKTLHIVGNYINSQRTGVWKFYRNGVEMPRLYNFDNDIKKDSLVEYHWNTNDSSVLRIRTSEGWRRKEVSSPPFPIYSDLNFLINHNLKYPVKAKKEGITGVVVVSIHVGKTGDVLGYRLDSKVNDELDQEALRIIKLVDIWYPAIYDGKKVECEYLIPVSFQLKKK